MERKIALGIICLCLAAAAGSSAIAVRAAGKIKPYAAVATFRDSETDQIISDGGGTYSNTGNVICQVSQSGSDQVFTLQLGSVGKPRLNRFLSFNYALPAPTECDPDGGPANGWFSDKSAVLQIHHLGELQTTDGPVARLAIFKTAVGNFTFAGQYYPNYRCSTNVIVTRTGINDWTVTTDAAPGTSLPAFEGGYNLVGNVAQWETSTPPDYFGGNFVMSFAMQIHCPDCK